MLAQFNTSNSLTEYKKHFYFSFVKHLVFGNYISTFSQHRSREHRTTDAIWKWVEGSLYNGKLDETVGTLELPMPGFTDLAVREIGKCSISMSFEGD